MKVFFQILLSLFVVLISPLTHARGGVIESSGAPPPPYIPKGEANYHCTMEIKRYMGRRQLEPVTSEVEFHTADFQANGVAYHSVDDQSFTIRFRHDPKGEGDLMILSATASLKTSRGGTVSSFARTEVPRAQQITNVYTSADFERRAGDRHSKSTSLNVNCETLP